MGKASEALLRLQLGAKIDLLMSNPSGKMPLFREYFKQAFLSEAHQDFYNKFLEDTLDSKHTKMLSVAQKSAWSGSDR